MEKNATGVCLCVWWETGRCCSIVHVIYSEYLRELIFFFIKFNCDSVFKSNEEECENSSSETFWHIGHYIRICIYLIQQRRPATCGEQAEANKRTHSMCNVCGITVATLAVLCGHISLCARNVKSVIAKIYYTRRRKKIYS